jgi:hypothetical protein
MQIGNGNILRDGLDGDMKFRGVLFNTGTGPRRNHRPQEEGYVKKATIIPVAIIFWMVGIAAQGMASGENLPKVLLLGSLSKVYEPVRFDHAEHVSMVGGCADCHHQHRAMQIQACSECHRIDSAAFKRNVLADKLLPCRDCHMASEKPGITGVPSLKAAYHQACLKCHWGEVGSAGKTLEGCTEMCHVPKAREKQQEKK